MCLYVPVQLFDVTVDYITVIVYFTTVFATQDRKFMCFNSVHFNTNWLEWLGKKWQILGLLRATVKKTTTTTPKNKQKLSRTVNHENPVKYHLYDLNTCHEYYSNA